jgi:hypothetical protein
MATYYINADTGNDTTGDGSQGNPWLTLSKANSSSASGDTIFCQNSTSPYSISGTISFSQDKIVIGESKEQVVFTNNNTSSAVFYFSVGAAVNVIIRNISFSNITSSGSYNGLWRNSGTASFENCIFSGLVGSTILGVSSGTWNITSCLFYNFTGNPFHYRSGALFNVYNNVIIFENSTPNSLFGQLDTGAGSNLKNNIFLNISEANVRFDFGNTPILSCVTNCLSTGFINLPTDLTNLTNTDPLFIDAANRNYNLSPSSPCIDAGTLI